MQLSLTRLKSWKTANPLAVRNTKKAKKSAAHDVLCLIYSKKLPNKTYTKPTKKFGGFLV